MEAAAMDELVEKGEFRPQVAQAIGEALDITIKAANLVTVPMLDARFAQSEAKMEARFGSIEARFGSVETRFGSMEARFEARFGDIVKSLEATKVWATLLYAGLTIAFFSALAVDHHWIVSREDQLMAQRYARSDASFKEQKALSDARFKEQEALSDARVKEQAAQSNARFAEQQARSDQRLQEAEARTAAKLDQLQARTDAKFDQLRTLILRGPLKPGS